MERMYIRLSDLEDQLTTVMQSELARSSCCIYKVPDTLIKINGKVAYHPQVVSIGPFLLTEGWIFEDQYESMEKHKREFLCLLLQRIKMSFDDLLESIRPLEKEARQCYGYNDNDCRFFLKSLVLDGCFLIELFRKANKDLKDPLSTIPRAVPFVYGDLLLLQNQIPFSILEKLFETSKKLPEESSDSLSLFALQFFNKAMPRPKGAIEKFLNQLQVSDQKPLHLLDLVWSSFLLPDPVPVPPKNKEGNIQSRLLIHSVSRLRRAGIQLKLTRKADSFLDVKFKNGVINMPNIVIDHCMKTFLLNCVAFEELHKTCSKQFTVYATFLDCLVDTKWDVGHLCERKIFDSYLGNYYDVVKFINNMGKDLVFADDQFYLSQLFEDVNKRCQSTYKVQWASFKRTYFNTPWSFISALAAFVLLVLTFLQTFYTIYAYLHPKA